MGEKSSAVSKLKKTLDIRIALAVSDAFTAGKIFKVAQILYIFSCCSAEDAHKKYYIWSTKDV